MHQTSRTGPDGVQHVLTCHLADPLFRAEWECLALAVALHLVVYRAHHGPTQTAPGDLLGMPQPAIATLVRLSEALGIAFSIDIRPRSRAASAPADDARTATVNEEVHTDRGTDILVSAN